MIFTKEIRRFKCRTYNIVPDWRRREHEAGLLKVASRSFLFYQFRKVGPGLNRVASLAERVDGVCGKCNLTKKGRFCRTLAKYEGNSISKLQIQVAT
jgi:hypothetical protein